MAKSIFGITASSVSIQRETILQVSERAIHLFKNLATIDSIFENVFFIGKDDNNSYPLNIRSSDSTKLLAELILKFERGSISKYEKEHNPTINFARDFGFSPLFQIRDHSGNILTVSITLGRTMGGGVSVRNFNKNRQFDFQWYYSVLKCLVNELAANVGTVSISNKAFIDLLAPLQVKYPLGWITYFFNDFEIPIPNDLEGMEYEYTDKGKYLILTRSDFTSDKDLYFKYRERLISSMNYLKENIPGYSKDTA